MPVTFNAVNAMNEIRLKFICSTINKLARLGILTDSLVAAATGIDDLISDAKAAVFVSSTTNNAINEQHRMLLRAFESHIRFMQSLDILTDTIVTNLLTVRGTSAATDLRYLVSSNIIDANFSAADEFYTEEASGANYGSAF